MVQDRTHERAAAPRRAEPIPWRAEPIIDWLFHKGRMLPDSAAMLDALCQEVVAAGLALDRANVFLATLHPLYYGYMLAWTPEDGVVVHPATHAERSVHAATQSPVVAVFEGERLLRRRLEGASPLLDYPILTDLREAGFTDYLATALVFRGGARNALTLATRRPGGFSGHDLAELEKLLHIFTLLLETDVNQTVAHTVLDTYVGPISGRHVLSGQVARGDRRRLDAVIWISDMRGSTRLSEELSDDAFLDLLNDYFEATAGALLAQGGEVLKFIGDATMGVIPIGEGGTDDRAPATACDLALAAAREALSRGRTTNQRRRAKGRPGFDFGIGLHMGEVMYGNVGVPSRLDFTVIGAAANHAARIEGMCKTMRQPVVASAPVAAHEPQAWTSLGTHDLRGAAEPIELFGLAARPQDG